MSCSCPICPGRRAEISERAGGIKRYGALWAVLRCGGGFFWGGMRPDVFGLGCWARQHGGEACFDLCATPTARSEPELHVLGNAATVIWEEDLSVARDGNGTCTER